MQQKKRCLMSLGKVERKLTPPLLAERLVERVRGIFQVRTVAALWVHPMGPYVGMEGVECYGEEEDARLYEGPHPVIAHPPCGPWGHMRLFSQEDKLDAIIALACVYRWGGVLEHPVGSTLLRQYAVSFGGFEERINQGDWGHRAKKPTYLYWVPAAHPELAFYVLEKYTRDVCGS